MFMKPLRSRRTGGAQAVNKVCITGAPWNRHNSRNSIDIDLNLIKVEDLRAGRRTGTGVIARAAVLYISLFMCV